VLRRARKEQETMDEQTALKETESGGGPSAAPKRGEAPRRQIRKAKAVSRRRFSAEEKIRIVMEGIRGDISVSELCRREGIHNTVYYKWLKEFMEAGKRRLRGDHQREADRSEVRSLKDENARLKQLVAEYALDLMALKKSLLAER
jgi:transposase